MNRRSFSKSILLAPTAGLAQEQAGDFYEEPARKLPVRRFDVVVAGAGTGGAVAAIAAARQGAKTAVIEAKGYPGGTIVEGGIALHSFYNLWKAFPGVQKKQLIRGIPQEIVDRLTKAGGCTGHAEVSVGADYDSVCTAVDTEIYKLVIFEMLAEAGVTICVNTRLANAIRRGSRVDGVIVESRSGREAFMAKAFVDATAYGDLAAYAGAKFTEPNDYDVANSVGLGNVSVEKLYEYLKSHDALQSYAEGLRDGKPGKIIRLQGRSVGLPAEFNDEARRIGMHFVTTTVHDNYFMFIKVNCRVTGKVTNSDDVTAAELELRRRQAKTVELFRKFIPGCENAFIARTSPSLNIRRGRQVICDYDIPLSDVLEARHSEDDVFVYGFHDNAPRLKIKNGGSYGVPYRALRVAGIDNLLATGMMITSNHDAHMSTRNTVSCMAQGQAAGTAAALCAKSNLGTRDLRYATLRQALEKANVNLEG